MARIYKRQPITDRLEKKSISVPFSGCRICSVEQVVEAVREMWERTK